MSEQKKRFSKAEIMSQGVDFSSWVEPDLRVFPDEIREKVRNRLDALKAFFLHGASCKEIRISYGVAKSSLYVMVDKALEADVNGDQVGYRAAILQYRTRPNERRAEVSGDDGNTDGAGDAGLFSQLLHRYPELEAAMRRYASLYRPRGEGGAVRIVDLHSRFLKLCEELGIVAPEYPFNRASLAERSFARHLHDRVRQREEEQRAKERAVEDLATLPTVEPLQEVELDGHRLGIRLTVQEEDTYGLTTVTEILTIWIILVIDVFTRCVLGYSLAFGKNYDQTDLLRAVYDSIAPRQKPRQAVAGVRYNSKGGFPFDKKTDLAWSCGLVYKLDNAMAHRAKDVEDKLRHVVGCVDDFGPPHQPNERAIVETFFHYLVENFSNKLVGTTGSHPRDEIIRRLAPKGGDLSLLLTVDELHQAMDVVLSDYNGRPHSGIAPHSPLQLFLRTAEERQLVFPKLRSEGRDLRKFIARTAIVRVRKDGPQSAFINFKGVRYRNLPVLSFSVGDDVMVEWDPMNISYLRVFTLKGGYLGEVLPPPLWCSPHSEKLRLRLLRGLKRGQIDYRDGDSVADLLRSLQSSEGWKDREAATYNLKHTGVATLPPAVAAPPKPIVKPVERLTMGFILMGDKK